MIKHIELKNFMSHPHTVIELAEGLTVLVGENNTGKSALINALQVLCRNAGGDYMVRHGEQECWVKAETDEGFVLEWKRKGSTVSYSINGTEVHRLRGSVPEELHNFLRLPLVETENNPFEIHFGEQKDPIFLLNESAGRRATFFASSSDTIKLIEMQNRHILDKLRWSLDYATKERLLPVVLGDLFHLPRNNPNWLLVEVIRLLNREILCIYGNHDIHENELSDDDSLSVIIIINPKNWTTS